MLNKTECQHRYSDQERRDLARVIDRSDLAIVLQPIVDLRTGLPMAYEALVRPPEWTSFENTEQMSKIAESEHRLWDLERLARGLALQSLPDLPPNVLLFINCSPEVLCDERILPSLRDDLQHGSPAKNNRVVIELTELSDPKSLVDLVRQFNLLRQSGFRFAIDDVGAGTSGLNRITALRPDCLKLDRELIAGIDRDPFRQNLLKFFVDFASLSNIKLITEGVEREEELRTLMDQNVDFAQGYLLGRPAGLGVKVDPVWAERVPYLRERAEQRRNVNPRFVRLKEYAVPLVNLDVNADAARFRSLVEHVSESPGIAILDGRQLIAYLPIQIARQIAQDHRDDDISVDLLLEKSARGWLVSSPETTLAEAILLATSRPDSDLAAPILVVSDDVVGLVRMQTLYRTAANLQPDASIHTSQLTGLPGRVQIDQQIERRIETMDLGSIAVIDLRSLSEYNRGYGFPMGDALIRHLGAMIVAHFLPPASEFVGHLSDDRFIVISRNTDFHSELLALANEFDLRRDDFFDAIDTNRNGFIPNGFEEDHRLPLTSLRIILLPRIFARASTSRAVYRLIQSMHSLDHARGPTNASSVVVKSSEDDLVLTDRRQCA